MLTITGHTHPPLTPVLRVQMCELMLLRWLPGFLQARSVDVSGGENAERAVTTVTQRESAAGEHFIPLIDPNRSPATWRLGGPLAAQLDAMVNRVLDESSAPPV